MNGNKTAFIIFGATGDLTHRKLMPSLYNLFALNKLETIDILALGRRDYNNDEYNGVIKSWIVQFNRFNHTDDKLSAFFNKVNYLKMNIDNINDYSSLATWLKTNEYQNVICYYAVAPSLFEIITYGLISIDCIHNTKIVIEKPFGDNLKNANQINELLINTFKEENIFRIDHYLGKQMVQGILDIRFKNIVFDNAWDNKSIESIKIMAYEKNGIGNRGSYYDRAGALKDMVQNQLMQIMTIVALEKPEDFNDIFNEQLKVLDQLQSTNKVDIKTQMCLGQYQGYKNEKDIVVDSTTETYAKLKLFINNKRWKNVPFYIETGKRMPDRKSVV